MPFLDELDFVERALVVSYRASAEPQELSIDVRLHHAEPDCIAPRRFMVIYDTIDAGAPCGTEFHPKSCSVELLAGTFDFGPGGPDLSWRIRVAGVSPFFIRTIVEHLRICGADDNPVVGMSIVGSLPLDASSLSVREAQVRAWLEAPGPYPGEWPDPGFPVRTKEAMGAHLRVRFKADLHEVADDAMRGLCIQWFSATHQYADQHGEPIQDTDDRFARLMPKFGATRRELRAYYEEFTRTRPESRALMINMLSKFHHTILPIEWVELAL